jgi:hypothetical protein
MSRAPRAETIWRCAYCGHLRYRFTPCHTCELLARRKWIRDRAGDR